MEGDSKFLPSLYARINNVKLFFLDKPFKLDCREWDILYNVFVIME